MSRLGVIAALLLLAGCAAVETPQHRIEKNPASFSALPADAQEKVRRGEVEIGFSPEAVELALGKPDRLYQRTTRDGVREVWSYVEVHQTATPETVWVDSPSRVGWHTTSAIVWTYPTHEVEALRVEFEDGKVSAIERVKPRE